MSNMPQFLSVCNDLDFFKDLSAIEYQKNSGVNLEKLCDLLDDERPEFLILSGKHLKLYKFLKSLSRFDINISLEIENSNFLQVINNFTEFIYQIRYPIFLEDISFKLSFLEKSFKIIKSCNYEYKVIVIYITKKSIPFFDGLQSLVDKLINLGFMICIFPLPYYFLKKQYRLEKSDFWSLADKVNHLAMIFGAKIYGDFPISGSIYTNIEGCCPSLGLMINISPIGTFTPCRFANITLGKMNDYSLSSVWKRWQQNIKNINNICNSCEYYLTCRGGCVANWSNSENIDYFCRFL